MSCGEKLASKFKSSSLSFDGKDKKGRIVGQMPTAKFGNRRGNFFLYRVCGQLAVLCEQGQ